MNPGVDEKDWAGKGTVVRSLGVIIAPKIFTAPNDILLSNGLTVLEGTKYFSWLTAKALVDEGKIPGGWRLPSLHEGEFLRDYYGRSGFGLLVLGLDGYVEFNDMATYTHNPEDTRLIRARGEKGYYWIDELEKPAYPYIISVCGITILASDSKRWDDGLPMLLVKDL